jgi:hypothetical protein
MAGEPGTTLAEEREKMIIRVLLFAGFLLLLGCESASKHESPKAPSPSGRFHFIKYKQS